MCNSRFACTDIRIGMFIPFRLTAFKTLCFMLFMSRRKNVCSTLQMSFNGNLSYGRGTKVPSSTHIDWFLCFNSILVIVFGYCSNAVHFWFLHYICLLQCSRSLLLFFFVFCLASPCICETIQPVLSSLCANI